MKMSKMKRSRARKTKKLRKESGRLSLKKRELFNGHKGSPVVITVTIGKADELPQLTVAKQQAAMQFEHAYLHEVMRRAGGSLSVAGRVAGYDRTNLRRRLEAHGINPKSFVPDEKKRRRSTTAQGSS
jgi:DNA-binding NtrC family response regulator